MLKTVSFQVQVIECRVGFQLQCYGMLQEKVANFSKVCSLFAVGFVSFFECQDADPETVLALIVPQLC